MKDHVKIRFPSRLFAMSLDSSKIAENNNSVFTAGAISFSVGIYNDIEVRPNTSGRITVTASTKRPSLVRHAGLLMKKALGFDEGLEINVTTEHDLRHTGLGSSGSTLTGTAAAINELFGGPIKQLDLARYITHNYGEEIENEADALFSVQSMGTTAMCGLLEGGLLIVSGTAMPINQLYLPDTLRVVIGVPNDYIPSDAETMMQAEIDNMDGFRRLGQRYAPEVAYRLVHSVMPELAAGNLAPLKALIFDHRWTFGSIRNCSFAYRPLIKLGEALRDLKDDPRASIISVSSVGPAFFALTNDAGYIKDRFESLGMRTIETSIHNGIYQTV